MAINTDNTERKVPFRWTYVIVPVGFFIFSLILAGIFFLKLPGDVSYHLRGGSPDKTISLGIFLAWMIIPQVFFVILSFSVTRLVMLGARYAPPGETPFSHFLLVMGNIMALPQIILFIVMLQFFLYNAYQTGLIPLWIIAVVVLALGGIFLVVYFTYTIRRFRRRKTRIDRE